MRSKNDVSTLRYARSFERLQLRTSGFKQTKNLLFARSDFEFFLALYHVRAILQGDVCKKTESGNCQRLRLFFGILSPEKAFEPGFWSEITITDLLKAKMADH